MYVKKIFLPATFLCLLTGLMAFSTTKAKGNKVNRENIVAAETRAVTAAYSVELASNLLYDSLHLGSLGLSKEAMFMAYKGQQALAERGVLNNDAVMAICDFSQSSKAKRLYIIDTKNFLLLTWAAALDALLCHSTNRKR
jgi:hypothetical protein